MRILNGQYFFNILLHFSEALFVVILGVYLLKRVAITIYSWKAWFFRSKTRILKALCQVCQFWFSHYLTSFFFLNVESQYLEMRFFVHNKKWKVHFLKAFIISLLFHCSLPNLWSEFFKIVSAKFKYISILLLYSYLITLNNVVRFSVSF